MNGLGRLMGQDVSDFSEPIAGFDQNASHACPVGHFYVGASVPNNIRICQVDVKRFTGLIDEACFRFSAVTGLCIFRDTPSGMVRAEENAVDKSPFLFQSGLEMGM